VQGVGPKVAQAVLGAGSPRELVGALAAGDAKRFQAVPGIGKRTAERIIVELREKVGVVTEFEPDGTITAARADDPRTIARDGLVELGYSLAEAEQLLAGAGEDLVTPEALIAHALKAARP
jgi:Holliday junction DNA helicase RuvA